MVRGGTRKPRRYQRLTFAEKRRFATQRLPEFLRKQLPGERENWRCRKCQCVVVPEDRAGHVLRCWPELLLKAFARVS